MGDGRLNLRLIKLATRFAEQPTASIPGACGDWAETMAAHRFFDQASTEKRGLNWESILQPHIDGSEARMVQHPVVLCLQDTTELDFAAMVSKPVLHGDNGSTLKATTVLAMLHWLGVKPSYSRPRVSDDNAYAESLFRTAKYRPEFPAKGFADIARARAWATDFVRWYNFDHRHSGIRHVSPAQRHVGEDQTILAARHELYLLARERNPARWSGTTRN